MNRKGFTPLILILIVIIFLVIGGGIYYYKIKNNKNRESQTEISCNVKKADNNIVVYGTVLFPPGILNQQNYVIIGNDALENKINADGSFCASGARGRPDILIATSKFDKNAFQLGVIINSEEDIHGLVVNSKSTAIASIYYSFSVGQPIGAAKIISTISSNSDVQNLANQIDTVRNLTINSLAEGGPLYKYRLVALRSVLKDVSAIATSTPVN